MEIRKTHQKESEKYHFSGVIKDAYEYTAKDGNDFVVLVCRDKQDVFDTTPYRDVLFSNYKHKFEDLSCGIDLVEPGSQVEVDYCIYKNEKNGKSYFNFIDVKFKEPSSRVPCYPSAEQIEKYWEEWKKNTSNNC